MEQQKAFDRSKQLLTSSQLLVHFNPDLEKLFLFVMPQITALMLCYLTVCRVDVKSL